MEEVNKARSEATFRHTVKNISKMKDHQYSPVFYVRNLPWKIMMCLSQKEKESKVLGFYLQCDKENRSSSWSCFAVAELRLLSCMKGQEPLSRKIQHLFCSKENDWGFRYFIAWQDVLDPDNDFIKDDSITLEVHVVANTPHGVISWDSKKHTDYVGLKNPDTMCHMNSLLQTIYFINQLHKTVYKMPKESDDSSKNVTLVLQRVYHKLLFSDKSVGTKKLTKSFGWETSDSFIQHDVQTFLCVLVERLQEEKRLEQIRSEEANLYMTVNVLLEDIFYRHQGNDLYDPEHALYRVFRVFKQATIHNFLELLRDSLEYPVEQIRIWPFYQRSNQTYRPTTFVPDADFQKAIIDCVQNRNPWNVFVELPPDPDMTALPPFDINNDVLYFFKLFDPKDKKIQYCGHHYMPVTAKVQELIPILNERAGFSPDTKLALYEEIEPNRIEKIHNLTEPLKKVIGELMNGDIIIFQKEENNDM